MTSKPLSMAADAVPACDMPEDHFGPDVAARYDESTGRHFEPALIERTVDVLAEIAGDGAALEFAIGTGRVLSMHHMVLIPEPQRPQHTQVQCLQQVHIALRSAQHASDGWSTEIPVARAIA